MWCVLISDTAVLYRRVLQVVVCDAERCSVLQCVLQCNVLTPQYGFLLPSLCIYIYISLAYFTHILLVYYSYTTAGEHVLNCGHGIARGFGTSFICECMHVMSHIQIDHAVHSYVLVYVIYVCLPFARDAHVVIVLCITVHYSILLHIN